jgi:hypothetical protein
VIHLKRRALTLHATIAFKKVGVGLPEANTDIENLKTRAIEELSRATGRALIRK